MDTLPSVKLDEKYRVALLEMTSRMGIPEEWHGTPIEAFIMSQNFGWPVQTSGKPELLIATCIEFRYALPVPRMYAYVIRRASGRVIGSEFSVGYTLAKGVRHMVMIGHNDCGMAHVDEAAPKVVEAFIAQGWSPEMAEAYVKKHGARHRIEDELEALKIEYIRLRRIFRNLVIAPLFVCLYDSKLYLPKWYRQVENEMQEEDHSHVDDEVILALP
jgi:carbonic anhydrase